MKKIVLIAIAIIMTLASQGQHYKRPKNYYNDALFITLQPGDLGVGLRYDHFYSDWGTYYNVTYGNYTLPEGGYIKDHWKAAIGTSYKRYSFGVSYHHFGDIYDTVGLTDRTLYNISCELGVSIDINRFISSIRWDILRGEGILDFGFSF